MVKNNNRVIREVLERVKQGRTWRRVVALLSVVTVLVTANRLTVLVVAMEHTPHVRPGGARP